MKVNSVCQAIKYDDLIYLKGLSNEYFKIKEQHKNNTEEGKKKLLAEKCKIFNEISSFDHKNLSCQIIEHLNEEYILNKINERIIILEANDGGFLKLRILKNNHSSIYLLEYSTIISSFIFNGYLACII